jgi:hypothetical protein
MTTTRHLVIKDADVEAIGKDRYRLVLSSEAEDYEGDVVRGATAAKTKIPWLVNHDHDIRSQIGWLSDLHYEGADLIATGEVAPPGVSELTDEVSRRLKAGLLRDVSIGFVPTTQPEPLENGYLFDKPTVIEASSVVVGANRGAELTASASSPRLKSWLDTGTFDIEDEDDDEPVEPIVPIKRQRRGINITGKLRSKGIVPADTNRAISDNTEWEKPTLADYLDEGEVWSELPEERLVDIASHYAWAAELPPSSFGSLSLPHHEPGSGEVNLAGLAAAASRFNQADIPDEDRAAVALHLAAHYTDAGLDVPASLKISASVAGTPETPAARAVRESKWEKRNAAALAAEARSRRIENAVRHLAVVSDRTLTAIKRHDAGAATVQAGVYKKLLDLQTTVAKLLAEFKDHEEITIDGEPFERDEIGPALNGLGAAEVQAAISRGIARELQRHTGRVDVLTD